MLILSPSLVFVLLENVKLDAYESKNFGSGAFQIFKNSSFGTILLNKATKFNRFSDLLQSVSSLHKIRLETIRHCS